MSRAVTAPLPARMAAAAVAEGGERGCGGAASPNTALERLNLASLPPPRAPSASIMQSLRKPSTSQPSASMGSYNLGMLQDLVWLSSTTAPTVSTPHNPRGPNLQHLAPADLAEIAAKVGLSGLPSIHERMQRWLQQDELGGGTAVPQHVRYSVGGGVGGTARKYGTLPDSQRSSRPSSGGAGRASPLALGQLPGRGGALEMGEARGEDGEGGVWAGRQEGSKAGAGGCWGGGGLLRRLLGSCAGDIRPGVESPAPRQRTSKGGVSKDLGAAATPRATPPSGPLIRVGGAGSPLVVSATATPSGDGAPPPPRAAAPNGGVPLGAHQQLMLLERRWSSRGSSSRGGATAGSSSASGGGRPPLAPGQAGGAVARPSPSDGSAAAADGLLHGGSSPSSVSASDQLAMLRAAVAAQAATQRPASMAGQPPSSLLPSSGAAGGASGRLARATSASAGRGSGSGCGAAANVARISRCSMREAPSAQLCPASAAAAPSSPAVGRHPDCGANAGDASTAAHVEITAADEDEEGDLAAMGGLQTARSSYLGVGLSSSDLGGGAETAAGRTERFPYRAYSEGMAREMNEARSLAAAAIQMRAERYSRQAEVEERGSARMQEEESALEAALEACQAMELRYIVDALDTKLQQASLSGRPSVTRSRQQSLAGCAAPHDLGSRGVSNAGAVGSASFGRHSRNSSGGRAAAAAGAAGSASFGARENLRMSRGRAGNAASPSPPGQGLEEEAEGVGSTETGGRSSLMAAVPASVRALMQQASSPFVRHSTPVRPQLLQPQGR